MTRVEVVAASAKMKAVVAEVQKAAITNVDVLITGESGTGKGVIARAVHQRSDRRGKLVEVHTGALTETLIESELFGHEKGAFTGALTRRLGRFELAAGGSIFLDEIGEMPMTSQVKLLRVLQDRVITRVGGTDEVSVDVRVIAATHRDLAKEIEGNRFREDLYYRINVFTIVIPPLRERPEDIAILTQQFISDFCNAMKLARKTISDDALTRLTHHPWPGNVRELENVIKRTIAKHADVSHIETRDLEFLERTTTSTPTTDPPPFTPMRKKAASWSKIRWDEHVPGFLGTLIVYRQTEGSQRRRLDEAHRLTNYMSRAVILEKDAKRSSGQTGREIVRHVLEEWRAAPHRSFSPFFSRESLSDGGFVKAFGSETYDYGRVITEFRSELSKLGWADENRVLDRQPQLPWMNQLVSIVNEGKWVFAPLLSGNGAEEVLEILRVRVPDAAVYPFDLGSVGDDFLSVLRDAACIDDNDMGLCQVAAALAKPASRLVLVVSGWGLHANQFGAASLGKISQTIKGFKNCPKPRIAIVAVSAIPLTHFVPPALVGSIVGELNMLVLSAQDEKTLLEWALSEQRGTSSGEEDVLIRLTGSQLETVRTAVGRGGAHMNDLSSLIRNQHSRAGNAIYADLPECCQVALVDVIGGNPGRASCVNALEVAGILTKSDGRLAPRVADWVQVFSKAENRS